MISRSTILALVFAFLATLSLAGVAEVRRGGNVSNVTLATPAPMPIYSMPRVVVVGKAARSVDATPDGN